MQFVLTLVSPDPAALMTGQSRATQGLAMAGGFVAGSRRLGPGALDLLLDEQ